MKLAILTAATCLFGFCVGTDPAQKDPAPQSMFPVQGDLDSSTLYESMYQPTGAMGSYLSANFAQRRFDWKGAYRHMKDIMDEQVEITDENEPIYRRAMLVSIGAGQYEEGFALADKLIESDQAESLTTIVKLIQSLKKHDFDAVKTRVETMPDDGLSRFMKPILMDWIAAEKGTYNVEGLSGLSLFHAQALLISDFAGKKDDLAKQLDLAMKGQDLKLADIEMIADGFTHIGEYDRAKQIYEQLLKAAPGYKKAQDKIDAIRSGKKPDYFKSPGSVEEGVARAFYDLAHLLYAQGNDETALFLVQLSNYLKPDDVKIQILLGSIAAENQRYDDAISYYSSVPEGDEQYIITQREIANLLEEQERRSEAIEVLENLAGKYGDIDSLIQIGDIYRREKEFDKAVNAYDRAASAIGGEKIPEEYWHLLYVRGMAYEQNGHWTEAQKDLEGALAYRPDNAYILNYLGYAWADQGTNIDKAKEMIEKAVKLEPGDGYITDSLGWVLYRTGHYAEAVKYLERAIALLPDDPVINDHLGDAYWQAGRRIEARFQWERARNNADKTDTKLLSFLSEKLENGLSESLIIKQAGANYNDLASTKKR